MARERAVQSYPCVGPADEREPHAVHSGTSVVVAQMARSRRHSVGKGTGNPEEARLVRVEMISIGPNQRAEILSVIAGKDIHAPFILSQ